MSRRNKKNRNIVRIGIFDGKSSSYNEAILETLWEQDRALTTMEIAKALQEKLKPTENREAQHYRVQKIYSVIQRKHNGRLLELHKKGYIVAENGKWRLSLWKGRLALFIRKPELLEKMEKETYREAFSLMKTRLKTPKDIHAPFGISINGKEFRRDTEGVLTKLEKDASFFYFIAQETKQLLSEGIDLDVINDEALVWLLASRDSVKKRLRKLL